MEDKGLQTCMTCDAATDEKHSYAVFYTFLKANGSLLADALERCLLLPDVATLPVKSHVLCEKCYGLLEEFTDLEERFRQLKSYIWDLHKIATSKRKQDVKDLIRGVSVQTDDNIIENHDDSTYNELIMTDESDENCDQVSKEVTPTTLIKEELTIDADPQVDSDEEQDVRSWNRWKQVPKICGVCGKWFKDTDEVEKHMKSEHSSKETPVVNKEESTSTPRIWKCAFCKKEFRSFRDNRVHMRGHRSERLVYKCRVCERSLTSKSGAVYHAKTHNCRVGFSVELEKAFKILIEPIKPDEKANKEENEQSSSGDELPLSKRRKEFLIEKIRQDVILKKIDVRTPIMQKKTDKDLGKFSDVMITKLPLKEKKDNPNSIKQETEDKSDGPSDSENVAETIENDELRSRISELSKSKSVIIQKGGIKRPMVKVRRFQKMALVKLNDKVERQDDLMLPPVREPKFKCDICDKMWKTKGELNAHKYTHSDARPYICEICGQAYKHKHALDVHVGMHKGIYQHQCPFCQKAFTQKGALQRHLPIHTGDLPYQCELCGKRFVHRTSFSIHTLAHSGVRNIKCEICNLGVLSKSHLRRHMRIHSGEKPYECASCGKTFAERYNLMAHQRIHDPNLAGVARTQKKKQQMCRLCSAIFPTRHKLEEHMIQDHNKVEDEPHQSRPSIFENSDSYLQSRFIINESGSSSKAESQNSDDVKRQLTTSVDLGRRNIQTLRGVDILRTSLDASLARISSGVVEPPHGWPYINPSS